MTTQIVVEGVKKSMYNKYGRYLIGGNTDTYTYTSLV